MAVPTLRLTVLGTRGSMTVSSNDCREFGGATSCYLIQVGSQSVILDAGSGLLSAPTSFANPPVMLLSHLHLDHIMGLGMYSRLATKGTQTYLYMPAQSRNEALRQLNGLFAPPYWPLKLTDYAGTLHVEPMPAKLRVGELTIDVMQGNHPGNSLVFRLSAGDKSLVYATDYEHDDQSFEHLVDFSTGTNLVLYDGQYAEGEYEVHRGFGHSTPQKGLELMRLCGAKRLLLVHHDPTSTDAMLRERERRLGCEAARFAREGDVIDL